MAERRLSSAPSPYPSEGQGASRLIAMAAVGGALAMVLTALGIVTVWPKWRWTESAAAGPPTGEAAQPYRAHHFEEAPEAPRRPFTFRSGVDDPALPQRSPRSQGVPQDAGRVPHASRAVSLVFRHSPRAARAVGARVPEPVNVPQDEPADADAAADEIETAARRAREQVEAEADDLETRAAAAEEASVEAFSRGRIGDAALASARQAAGQVRMQANSMREVAQTAEEAELARASRLREAGRSTQDSR